MALSICNVTSEVDFTWIIGLGGLAFALAGTSGVLYISDTMHSFDHGKSSSVSQLINDKSRNSKNSSNTLTGQQLLCLLFNLLLSLGVLSINFVLYSKDVFVIV